MHSTTVRYHYEIMTSKVQLIEEKTDLFENGKVHAYFKIRSEHRDVCLSTGRESVV